jgi:DNA-binding CsgD family transcriptional regulator
MATAAFARVPTVIDAIGTPGFEDQFVALLHQVCGAEHCALYRMGGNLVESVGAASINDTDSARRQAKLYADGYWRRDPSLAEARRRGPTDEAILVRLRPMELTDHDFRDTIFQPKRIRDRVLVCGSPPNGLYGFAVLRSDTGGPFSAADLGRLRDVAVILLSALAKHAALIGDPGWSPVPTLESLPDIEHRLGKARARLSSREVQVCARILYGMSTATIAGDLAIKEESVATYRKRSYRRLEVSGRHELLKFYLQQG